MATLLSEYADRLDLVAGRQYGGITETRTAALFRANPAAPLAMKDGWTITAPDTPQRLNYGSTFAGWNYPALVAIIATHAPAADFNPDDFDPRDFLTEI